VYIRTSVRKSYFSSSAGSSRIASFLMGGSPESCEVLRVR
jgi:hypothetical protein